MNINEAIRSLRSNTSFSTDNGKIIAWDISEEKSGETQPTEAEIDAEVIRLEKDFSANQYQRDRQYPSIGDQLDMQYHDQLDGTTTWKDAVAKVKSDNPKPDGWKE